MQTKRMQRTLRTSRLIVVIESGPDRHRGDGALLIVVQGTLGLALVGPFSTSFIAITIIIFLDRWFCRVHGL
jgi:hypothetical protein